MLDKAQLIPAVLFSTYVPCFPLKTREPLFARCPLCGLGRRFASYSLGFAQSGHRPVKMMSKPSIWKPWVSRTLESSSSLGISTS